MAAFEVLMTVIGIAIFAGIYCFPRVSIFTIAIRRDLRRAWLTWLPVGDQYILGSISDQYRYETTGKKYNCCIRLAIAEFLFLVVNVLMVCWLLKVLAVAIAGALGAIAGLFGLFFLWTPAIMDSTVARLEKQMEQLALIGSFLIPLLVILTIWRTIVHGKALLDLYRSCKPEMGVLFTVLSLVFPPLKPFFLRACRYDDDGMPEEFSWEQNPPALFEQGEY